MLSAPSRWSRMRRAQNADFRYIYGALCVCLGVCSFCLCLCLNIHRPACISVAMFFSTNNMICISNPGGVRGEGGVVGGEGGERAALQAAPHRPDGEEQEGGGEQVGRGGCWWCGLLMVRATYRWPLLVLLIAGRHSEEVGIECLNQQRKIPTCLYSSNCVSQSFQLPRTVNRWSCHSLSNWLNFQPSH